MKRPTEIDRMLYKPNLITTSIGILSSGMMFGDEDAFNMSHYSKTAKCRSKEAEVFMIAKQDFLDLARLCRNTMGVIKKREEHRSDAHAIRLLAFKKVQEPLQ